MSKVFVVDAERRPLMPCTPARARIILKQGKAAVLRRFPFTLRLKEAKPTARTFPLRLKIDPGSNDGKRRFLPMRDRRGIRAAIWVK